MPPRKLCRPGDWPKAYEFGLAARQLQGQGPAAPGGNFHPLHFLQLLGPQSPCSVSIKTGEGKQMLQL